MVMIRIAIPAVAVSLVIAVGARSSSAEVQSAASLIKAASVIKSDGYSPIRSETQAVTKSSFGTAASYISSVSEGQKSGSLEEVIIGTAGGAGFLESLAVEFRSDLPSAKVSVGGDVLRVVMPIPSRQKATS